MDLKMPKMNGLEATRKIRALEAAGNSGTRMPIIALTASAQPEDRKLCMDAGCDDFLSKPIRYAELLQLVAKYL